MIVGHPRRRPALAAYAGIIAISAYAGALGLATGALDTRGSIDEHLPFHSPVFGGVALAIVVGIPTTIVALYAWSGNRNIGPAALVAGTLLIGWIAVELAAIREFSWLQLFYVGVGATFIAVGAGDPSLARSRYARRDRVRRRASPDRAAPAVARHRHPAPAPRARDR